MAEDLNLLTVIIPTYNRASQLPNLLAAYESQQTSQPFELIVVDDASRDDTWEILQAYQPQNFVLRVIRQDVNAGQGMARNRAIPEVQTPLTLIAGDDMFPLPGMLQGHLDAHARWPDERAAILGRAQWPAEMEVNTLMAHIDGVGAQQFPFHHLQDDHWYGFEHFYTHNISLKTDFLRSLDTWFSPAFRIYGFEDIELGYRLAQKGMRIRYLGDVGVAHYHPHTIESFSQRQINAGKMAQTLFSLHPRLRLTFPRPSLNQVQYALRALFTRPNPTQVEALCRAALAKAKQYEWQPAPGLDDFYRAVLEYFYYQGFLDAALARFPWQPAAQTALARRMLAPALARWNDADPK